MSAILWRIAADTPDYEAHDLSGKGAERTGGRWNRKGTAMVYTSTSRALACLETVVHLSGENALPLNRYLVQIEVPSSLWKARVVFDRAINIGWDAEPAGKVSLDWGTAWARGQVALLAEVPSVIVPEEANVIINPAHADAPKLTSVKVRGWGTTNGSGDERAFELGTEHPFSCDTLFIDHQVVTTHPARLSLQSGRATALRAEWCTGHALASVTFHNAGQPHEALDQRTPDTVYFATTAPKQAAWREAVH